MKWLPAIFSFASLCGLLLAAADAPEGSELSDDNIRQREVRRFNGGGPANFNPFFDQGLLSQQGNRMVNWNSLLSKKKRQMEFYPSKGFNQGLGNSALQDWSSKFGRDGRAFAGPSSGLSSFDSKAAGGSLNEDGMQDWRAFFSRYSRKRRSSSNSNNES